MGVGLQPVGLRAARILLGPGNSAHKHEAYELPHRALIRQGLTERRVASVLAHIGRDPAPIIYPSSPKPRRVIVARPPVQVFLPNRV